MPKRTAQSEIERYRKKIKKLEEHERRRRIIAPLISSSDDEGNEDSRDATCNKNNEAMPMEAVTASEIIQPAPTPIDVADTDVEQPGPSTQDEASALVDSELDPELLSALGESMSDTPEYGDKIHENLSILWIPLLKKGMPKENRDKMLKDYPVPDNCRLLQAPKLNAEIYAAIPDMVRNRDKLLIVSQQQLGSGITAINRGLDILLKSDDKAQAMRHLSNACRLLCDSHNSATKSRIKLLTPSLDKTFSHIINESERDETLFGSSLSEKIKAAKAIEKQGLQIKKPVPKPQKQSAPQSSARHTSSQGNWAAPPRYPANRGGRGGYRKPQATVRRAYSALSTQPRAVSRDNPRVSSQNPQ